MSNKKNTLVLPVTVALAVTFVVAAITCLALGYHTAFEILRNLAILVGLAGITTVMTIFYEEVERLREENDDLHLFNHLLQQQLRAVEKNADLNNDAHRETRRDAREAWAEVERLEGELVMANNWGREALAAADDLSRRADVYQALYGSVKARAGSKFALPSIEGELTEEELDYRRRMTAAKFEKFLAVWDEEPKTVKATIKTAAKPAAKRGHRCGRSTPSPREVFHYLNR